MRIFFFNTNKIFVLITLLIILSCKKGNPNNFTLITYGYSGIYSGIDPDPDKGNARYKVAEKWGITFSSPGCVVSDEDEKKAFWNNIEASDNIEDKYGDDWIEKFNKEVNAEYALEKYCEKNHPIPNTNLVENHYPTTKYGSNKLFFKFISDTIKSKLTQILVFNKGKLFQEIKADKEILDKNFDLIDWNFDGYKDITVLNNSGDRGYSYWIWNYDPKSQKFIYNKTLSEVNCLEQDVKLKLIVIHFQNHWPSETRDFYLYKNDKLFWKKGIYYREYEGENYRITWKETTTKRKVKNKIITTVKKVKIYNPRIDI